MIDRRVSRGFCWFELIVKLLPPSKFEISIGMGGLGKSMRTYLLSWLGCLVSKVVWKYDYTRRCNAELGVSLVYTFVQAFCWLCAALTFAGSCVIISTTCISACPLYSFPDGSATDSTPLLEEHVRIRIWMTKISKIFQLYLLIQISKDMIYVVVVIFVILRGKIPRTHDCGILGLFLFAGLRECPKNAADVTDRAEGVAALASCCHALAVSADGEPARLPEMHQTLYRK